MLRHEMPPADGPWQRAIKVTMGPLGDPASFKVRPFLSRQVRNLDVLVKAEEVAPELRSYLWSTFRQFCSGPPSENKRPPPDQRDPQSPSFKRLNSNNHRPTELHIQVCRWPRLSICL